MAHYLASYDLHRHRDYSKIIQRLTETGGVRLLESLWLISSHHNVVAVRDDLTRFIDGDDSVAVIEIKPNSNWSTLRAKNEGVAWLKQHIAA